MNLDIDGPDREVPLPAHEGANVAGTGRVGRNIEQRMQAAFFDDCPFYRPTRIVRATIGGRELGLVALSIRLPGKQAWLSVKLWDFRERMPCLSDKGQRYEPSDNLWIARIEY